MKALICAISLALVPTVASAGDMHGFDYTGTGNPVALAAPSETLTVQVRQSHKILPSTMFLTRDSDFSKFVKADVPVDTHRQAMRLLWSTNPELGRPVIEDTLAVGYAVNETQTLTVAALAE